MDEDAKTRFKWKFYRLTLQLNAIILLVAVSVIGIFLPQIPYRIYLIAVALIIALVLLVDFLKKYRETKAWLDIHAQKPEESKEENTG